MTRVSVCFAPNVYSNCLLTNDNKYSQCSFATAIYVGITYNTDNVRRQKSLNRPSVRIPLSSPYIWLETVFMIPVTTSMSGLLGLKVPLEHPVGLGSTTLTMILRRKPLTQFARTRTVAGRKCYLVKRRV